MTYWRRSERALPRVQRLEGRSEPIEAEEGPATLTPRSSALGSTVFALEGSILAFWARWPLVLDQFNPELGQQTR